MFVLCVFVGFFAEELLLPDVVKYFFLHMFCCCYCVMYVYFGFL